MRITYTEEPEPLGTVGALSLLRDVLDDTFLTVNGDVLTDLNLNALLAAHRQDGHALTVATAKRTMQIDFGVLEENRQHQVTLFKEKPVLSHLVSTGIYCMEPSILDYIPAGVPFGFDDLMYFMLARGLPVHNFLHEGLWFDIGRVEDFQLAQETRWDEDPRACEVVPLIFDEAAA
jgi:mannose-1-phosphate guanylyltransferase